MVLPHRGSTRMELRQDPGRDAALLSRYDIFQIDVNMFIGAAIFYIFHYI